MVSAAVGAAAGSAVPGVGTAISAVAGGILGALGGGTVGTKIAKATADGIVDDDSKRLVAVLQGEIQELAFEHMLTKDEVECIVPVVKRTVDQKWLRRMFRETRGESERVLRKFVRREFELKFETLIKKRPKITLPTIEKLEKETSMLADTMSANIDWDDADGQVAHPVRAPL